MKFWIQSLGCKANFTDGQQIESGLRRSGYVAAASAEDADLIVVNSCTVTNEADKQSQKAVTQASRANPNAKIVYTGCGAEVSPENALKIPGVSFVVGNQNKAELAGLVLGPKPLVPLILGTVQNYDELTSRHPMDREWLEPELDSNTILDLTRGEGTFRTRAFLRIQEGCDHFCTYCVIPYGRGPSRAVEHEKILKTARELITSGVQEIILTGTNIGDTPGIEDVIEKLLVDVRVPRLRVSSLDPVEISPRITDLMAQHESFCPHFHVSLQSVHPKILKLMKRKYSWPEVEECLNRIASIQRQPVFVGMDYITGFPGEDEEIYQWSLNALRALPWTRLHVFPYSEREGTPATRLLGSVPMHIRKERAKELNALSLQRMTELFQGRRQKAGALVGVAAEARVGLDQILVESIVRPKSALTPMLSGYTKNYERVWIPVTDETAARAQLNTVVQAQAKNWIVDRVANEVFWLAEK